MPEITSNSAPRPTELLDHAAAIVASYVSHNATRAEDVPGLIAAVHGALAGLGGAGEPAAPVLTPAVPIKKSVTPDHIICLEDGRKFRSLKRHLGTVYGLTPQEYRAKWGLPSDYPMVAPAYSEIRSKLAKDTGLGSRPAPGAAGMNGREPAADARTA